VEGPQFFKAQGSLSIAEIISLTGAEPRSGAALDRRIRDVAPSTRPGQKI
jgi:hypothetical protein